jgi:hypothetical protein
MTSVSDTSRRSAAHIDPRLQRGRHPNLMLLAIGSFRGMQDERRTEKIGIEGISIKTSDETVKDDLLVTQPVGRHNLGGRPDAATTSSENWGLDDPAGQPIEKVREIREEIRRNVEEMIAEIVLGKEGANR